MTIAFVVLVSLAGATVGLIIFYGCCDRFATKVPVDTMNILEALFGISGAILAVVWYLIYLGVENLL